jgi:eukaryotic-like serine/threonine-protein kinase
MGLPQERTRGYSIGRYEIAGHIATGGMAEILLGRMSGPAGFERPIVVKRILPHLARDEHFVRMFLDEARLASGIRNRNVVQVHELLEHEGELALVMEYLEGESLSGLVRRLARRGRVLEPLLCAYVIAEAAVGLHAAHELMTVDGKRVGLVHRDVSPQNIFITYDGTVKVLDFGIAKGADRTSRTETGQLKGKVEYMSPEQCAGKELDPRSDVFSLGVVFWEIATGHRLFKRRNPLLTLHAITSSPIERPSSIVPSFPKEYDAVVLKALERGRADRYQTAAELRRDLLRATQKLFPEAVPDESLHLLMRELFDDRMDEKRAMLARLRDGAELSQVPEAEVDVAVELPTVLEQEPSVPSIAPQSRSGARWLWLAAGLTLVLVGAAGLTIALLAPSAQPEETPAAPVTSESDESPPAASTVRVSFATEPAGADVMVDGRSLGTTPFERDFEVSSSTLSVRLEKRGYVAEEMPLVPNVTQQIRLRLTREPVRRNRTEPRARMTEAEEPVAPMYDRFD